MNRYQQTTAVQPANTNNRRYTVKSRHVDYRDYVWGWSFRFALAGFVAGLSFVAFISLFSVAAGVYSGDVSLLRDLSLLGGFFAGSVAAMWAYYDRVLEFRELLDETNLAGEDTAEVAQPSQPVRWVETKRDAPRTMKLGKWKIDQARMGEWADVVLERGGVITRDDIPSGIFQNKSRMWQQREIQGELIRLGDAVWVSERAGSIRLSESGIKKWAEY